MSIVRLAMMAGVAAITGVVVSATLAAQSSTIKGRLEVEHLLPELVAMHGKASALPSVLVRVQSRSQRPDAPATWSTAGQTRTAPDGRFELTAPDRGEPRQFRLQLVFDADRLSVLASPETSPGAAPSSEAPGGLQIDAAAGSHIEIRNDAIGLRADDGTAGVVDFGTILLDRGAGRVMADLWILYGQVAELLAGYGADYALKDKIAVMYEMTTDKDSFADSGAGRIVLNEHDVDARIAIHQLFHLYLHQLSGGGEAAVWPATRQGHASRWREKTVSAAHQEAFAEWAAHKALQAISGGKLDNFIGSRSYAFPHAPLSRRQIASVLPLTERSIAHVGRTLAGWHSLFNILTYEKANRLDFNDPLQFVDDGGRLRTYGWYAEQLAGDVCPEDRYAYSFRDVLSIYLADGPTGIDSMDLAAFFERASRALDGLGADDGLLISAYLNPIETKNPCKTAS